MSLLEVSYFKFILTYSIYKRKMLIVFRENIHSHKNRNFINKEGRMKSVTF